MKGTVLLLGLAALFLMIAMISPAAAQPDNVTGIHDYNGANDVVPGETYIAYNFTYTEADTSLTGGNLTWFNITDWNNSIITTTNVTFDDIVNITLWNATTPTSLGYIGHNNSTWTISAFNISINLSNYWVPTGNKANITVNITLNTTGLVDGEQIAFNASLRYISNVTGASVEKEEWANDTAAETIEVLNATAGTSAASAWEGNKNVLCANVTIFPGNNSVPNYLKAITFNTTAATTINPIYIESFRLWNDSNANKTFDLAKDALINSSSPTGGTNNVSFNLSTLSLNNRTIPAGQNGTFFLTMNLTKPGIYTPVYRTVIYQAEILPQGITINQTAIGEGNTGNNSATTFDSLGVNLIARVPEFNTTGLIAFIGIVSVVLAVVTLRRKR